MVYIDILGIYGLIREIDGILIMVKDERVPIILNYAFGKEVLDVGCANHISTKEQAEDWLHRKICKVAGSVTGLDNNEVEVKKLENKYNVICGDAQTIDLKRKFDCVVAGELIEHLENPGLFLRNMLKHLKLNGYLVLTTPNPFYLHTLLNVLKKKPACENGEHTCWFCDTTITHLLKMAGFDNIRICFTNRSRRFIGRLPSIILNKRFSSNILVIAQRKKQSNNNYNTISNDNRIT